MKTYTVIVDYSSYRDKVDVKADYVKNEAGALIFKKEVRNSYPEVIHTFAPGRWLEFWLA